MRPTLSPVTLVQFVFFRYGLFFLKGFPVRAFFSQRIYSVNPWRFTFESFFGKINVLGEIYSAPGGHLFGQGGFKNSKKKLFSGELNLQCIVSSAYPKSTFLVPHKKHFSVLNLLRKIKKQISLLNSLKQKAKILLYPPSRVKTPKNSWELILRIHCLLLFFHQKNILLLAKTTVNL